MRTIVCLVAGSLILLSGCGRDDSPVRTEPAAALEARADAVASALDAGDCARARAEALALQDATARLDGDEAERAIAREAADWLVSSISCSGATTTTRAQGDG